MKRATTTTITNGARLLQQSARKPFTQYNTSTWLPWQCC